MTGENKPIKEEVQNEFKKPKRDFMHPFGIRVRDREAGGGLGTSRGYLPHAFRVPDDACD